ncbi:scavenger receptor cysteine-rich type 1 protein M130-like isoform X2 [Dendronephthya gigantea]|uniref:scavenger receptor cysteine-rich type 1 protein M130-like isoform X2 n=1 Tax=Dendronephthya gigantea TaxID=151771 RepID=UPI00106AA963|nr:scavenger receptor cysteine-rich type 1 protein M130-like isoform X2 [Dendronephthya gigantea]
MRVGFSGCLKDINECALPIYTCHPNLKCNNTNGSYICTCDGEPAGDNSPCLDESVGIRLRGPLSSKGRGRVEIFHDGRWGTVCDDNWDIKDARVVCRQLGYLNAVNALQGSNTISGSGPIWLDEVFCAGSEHNLSSCSHRGWGNNDCSHSEDAGVECSFNDIDECSLNTHYCASHSYCVNTHGSFSCECKKGYTGNNVTCVDIDECSTFDNCHQNAFCNNTIGSFHCTCNDGYTGNGTFCQDIDECIQSTHNCMANYNCTNTDGSYLCTCDNQHATIGSACVPTNVRLRGLSSQKGVGRVEVFRNGTWGTVCDTNWDLKDAKVVCRELGYLNAVRALQGGQVSRGSGQIWLNDLACTGNEQFLNNCSHNLAFRSNNCDHSRDAGVECTSTVARYNTYLIKSSSYGYLRRFDENHLHFSRHPGNHFRFIKENILQEANTGKCVHARNDLFVGLSYHCDGPTASRWRYDSFARHLKLVNKYPNYCVSPWRYYGKPGLEVSPGVSHDCNSWNRMALELDIDECSLKLDNCGNNSRCIDSPGAFSCVCLDGYSGNGIICNDIDECSTSAHNCHPKANCTNTDGSFLCICDSEQPGDKSSCKGKDIRLIGPLSSNGTGRVELFHSGKWGTICDDVWDINDARVACRQLGYRYALKAFQGEEVPSGFGQIWLDQVACTGNEQNLTSCPSNGVGRHDCSHSEDAGVQCTSEDIDHCALELDNCDSHAQCSKTFHGFSCKCNQGFTGSGFSCTDLDECSTFDNCHQNAFCTNTIGSFHCTCNDGYTGNGTFCQDIDECLQSTNNCMANYNCTNTDGSYLCTCDNQHATNGSACVSTNVRLRGPSSSKGVGRVEVLHNGSWGTVCDTNWDLKDAKVVCRELGYLNAVRALQGGQVSRGSGQIWLNDVACTGNEQFLNSCSHHLAFRSNNCDHSKDAGVECSSTVARYNTYLIKSSSYGYLRRFGENHLHFSRHPGNHFRFIKENILQEANTGKCVHARNDLFVGLSYHCDGPTASRWRYDSFARHLKLVNKYPNYCVSPWRYYGKPGLEVSPGVSHVCNSWNRMALELDIDECSLKLDNCGNNSRCIDSPGAFSCVCLEGYSGNGLICNDIDECSLSTDNCLPNSSCVNTAGSYRCICDDREVGNGTSCKGKDIRLKGPSISNGTGRVEVFYNGEWGTVCDDNWDIKDANVACRQLGYLYAIKALQGGNIPSGSGRIWSDEVACTGSEQKLSSCGRHVRGWGVHDCSHEEDAGVECSSIDVDECLSGSYYCGTHAKCINTLGSYICQCETGYTGNGLICNDIDECFLSLDNCLAGSNCTNTDGSYFCSCDSGHYSNGSVCHAMSVRLQGPSSLNGSGLVEVFYDGLWGAVCGDGWDSNAAEVVCRELGYAHVLRAFRQKLQNVSSTMSFEKISCVGNEQNLTSCSHDGSVNNTCSHSEFAAVECLKDIDECSRDLDNCGDNSRCVNTVGSFECICNHGYTGDGVNCEDIDECHLLVDNCHESSTCSNLKGSYVCTCNSGFTGDGTVCQDLDECSLSSHNCHENSHCTNVNGSFLCTCVNGYTGNGIVCQDIDECLLPTNNNCQQNSKCTNFGGSFSCTCNDGYTGNGVVCEDINECVEQEVSCDSNADCLNTNGSYECRCKEGLTGDGYNCEAPAEKEILHRKSESPENKFFSFPNLAYIIVGLILLLGIILLVILIRRRRRRSYRPFPDNDNLELMLKDDFHPGIGDDNKNQGSPDSKAFISNDCGGLLDQDELNHATEC